MKKFLRFVVIFLAVVIVGLLILGVVEPKDITVTRTMLIKAPKNDVFEQVVKFKNWPNWSPFYELDTAAKLTYRGTDGAEGSSYSWDSKKGDVGAGSMTNTGVAGTTMNFHIDFEKPFRSTANGFMKVSDSAKMTKVTWSFSTHCPFPLNALQVFPFLSMEKMLGSSFDHGLDKMKQYVEAHPVPVVPEVEVKEVDFPAHIYLGIRQTVGWADIQKFFGDTYGAIGKELGPKINGPAAGLYYTWDTLLHNTDVAAVFPVSDSSTKVLGTIYIPVEASKAFMAVLKGSYSGEMNVHNALHKRVAASGKTQTLVVEEYVAGPHESPDSTKWITNVYYLVK